MLQFQGKLETLKQQIDSKPLLKDIVAADKAAKVATVRSAFAVSSTPSSACRDAPARQ